ncbi:MAG: hypothetical protein NTX97_03230 [Bacteroidetes bacterium]|jgi:hypothetical protein|nr:hypothetical protein [Bacteroidota bacterium]
MDDSFRAFFVKLTLFSVFTLGLLFLWQHYASPNFQSTIFWVVWLFFIFTTAIIHVVLIKAARKDPKKFITYFMGITGIKLFAYLIIILIYGLLNRDTAQGFIICFLISYFLYSGFEVVTLTKHFKK